MRVLRVALLLVVTAVLLAGCDSRAAVPIPTRTTSAAVESATIAPTPWATAQLPGTATPTAVTAPVRLWQNPPPSGVSLVDTIVAAVTSGDQQALATFVERGARSRPCTIASTAVGNPGDLKCVEGAAVGTPTLTVEVWGGGCDGGGPVRINPPGTGGASDGTTAAAFAEQILRAPLALWGITGPNRDPGYGLYFVDRTSDVSNPRFVILAVNEEGVEAYGSQRYPACNTRSWRHLEQLLRDAHRFVITPPP